MQRSPVHVISDSAGGSQNKRGGGEEEEMRTGDGKTEERDSRDEAQGAGESTFDYAVMTYIVMAYIGMIHIAVACIVVAYKVLARSRQL